MSVRHVRGRVVDSALNPVSGALVECYLDVDAAATVDAAVIPLLVKALTDVDGWYALDLAANDDFDVWVTGTTYTVRILKASTSSELSILVTNDAYPPGQLDPLGNPYLDVKDLIVEVTPVAGPVLHGPPGPPGTGFDFAQPTPAVQWGPINHGLGRLAVGVAVADATGNKRNPQVQAVDPDNVVLNFNDLVAGSARCM